MEIILENNNKETNIVSSKQRIIRTYLNLFDEQPQRERKSLKLWNSVQNNGNDQILPYSNYQFNEFGNYENNYCEYNQFPTASCSESIERSLIECEQSLLDNLNPEQDDTQYDYINRILNLNQFRDSCQLNQQYKGKHLEIICNQKIQLLDRQVSQYYQELQKY